MSSPDVDLAYAIGLPPKDALDYLAQRGRNLPTGMRWQDVWQRAHARAFTVAGVMKADVLGDIHASLVDARTKGIGFGDWEKAIVPTLEKKGWYTKTGPRLIADPETGELLGKKLTPARMRLIYDQNMQTAYMAGRYKQMKANAEFRPWWQYTAVMDGRTRPAHRALHGKTFRHDDPFWDSFYPPNGFRCRCSVRAFGDADIEARGIPASSSEGRLDSVQKPVNRRGTETAAVARYRPIDGPPVTVDVGFNYNAGEVFFRPFTPKAADVWPPKYKRDSIKPPLPEPTPVTREMLLEQGRGPEYYAEQFLAVFGASIGSPVVFPDAVNVPVVISDALFRDQAGGWKSLKRGRSAYTRLLAQAIKEPDEIWLRFEEMQAKPGQYRIVRRYIKSFMLADQFYGLAVFELDNAEWSGLTAFAPEPMDAARRENYIENQRAGALIYRRIK